MKYRKPKFYDEFSCVASECPSTCCAGWNIGIDAKTLKKYRNEKSAFGNRLANSVDWDINCFQHYDGHCALLNEEKLCDIHAELGEDYLCSTCKTYPRHVEEFQNVREYSLGLSCPEVARLLLSHTEKIDFIEHESSKQDSADEDFDPVMYEILLQAREVIFTILQGRSRKIAVRMSLALAFTHDLQKRINARDSKNARRVIARYRSEKVLEKLSKKVSSYHTKNRLFFAQNLVSTLGKLESINADWSRKYSMLTRFISRIDETTYDIVFAEYKDDTEYLFEIYSEQLMIYYVFSYFCGAAYDGDAYTNMKFAVFSVLSIQELCFAEWALNGGELSLDTIIENVYSYARELEHEDDNLELLEDMLFQEKSYCLDSFLHFVMD